MVVEIEVTGGLTADTTSRDQPGQTLRKVQTDAMKLMMIARKQRKRNLKCKGCSGQESQHLKLTPIWRWRMLQKIMT